uniref:uncharacterized protein LOC100182590 isoform X2 n=1 Tax=Ciona intestinalis TaxID=7719 RepID=UPI000EF4E9AA|nr:uncharacterized protein LOC100182590 isoform X2 [Ciona intestinalis]|eukprot:XP_026691475.1 uncharacterized protein LOC100182590 isoform X2 [Ciona intestinalis]
MSLRSSRPHKKQCNIQHVPSLCKVSATIFTDVNLSYRPLNSKTSNSSVVLDKSLQQKSSVKFQQSNVDCFSSLPNSVNSDVTKQQLHHNGSSPKKSSKISKPYQSKPAVFPDSFSSVLPDHFNIKKHKGNKSTEEANKSLTKQDRDYPTLSTSTNKRSVFPCYSPRNKTSKFLSENKSLDQNSVASFPLSVRDLLLLSKSSNIEDDQLIDLSTKVPADDLKFTEVSMKQKNIFLCNNTWCDVTPRKSTNSDQKLKEKRTKSVKTNIQMQNDKLTKSENFDDVNKSAMLVLSDLYAKTPKHVTHEDARQIPELDADFKHKKKVTFSATGSVSKIKPKPGLKSPLKKVTESSSGRAFKKRESQPMCPAVSARAMKTTTHKLEGISNERLIHSPRVPGRSADITGLNRKFPASPGRTLEAATHMRKENEEITIKDLEEIHPIQDLRDVSPNIDDADDAGRCLFRSIRSKKIPLQEELRIIKMRSALQQNAKVADGFITMHRCFSRWRKNVRLMKNVQQQNQEKMERALLHHKRKIFELHFHAWRDHIRKQVAIATTFHRYHILAKGMTALKWMIHEASVRDNSLKRIERRKVVTKLLTVWKSRLHTKQATRMSETFNKWRSRHQDSLQMNSFIRSKDERCLSNYFTRWRQKYHTKRADSIAVTFNNLVLTRKVFNLWNIYVADCDVKRTRNVVAHERFQLQTLITIFTKWKDVANKSRKAKKLFKKKITKICITHWSRVTPVIKLRHQRDAIVAVSVHARCLVRRIFNTWCHRLKHRNTIKEQRNESLRFYFNSWKSYIISAHARMEIAEYKHRNNVLDSHMTIWKEYVLNLHERRSQASVNIQRCYLRSFFITWRSYIMGRKHNVRLAQQVAEISRETLLSSVLMQWEANYFRRISDKSRKAKWSDWCVRDAATQWLKYVRERKKRRCLQMARIRMEIISLKTNFRHWHEVYTTERSNQQRALNIRNQLNSNMLIRIINEWRKLIVENYRLQPYIERKQRKLCARVFDAWFGFSEQRRRWQRSIEIINNARLRSLMTTWTRGMRIKKMMGVVRRRKEDQVMRGAILSWRVVVVRRSAMVSFIKRKDARSRRTSFHSWKVRAKRRREEWEENEEKEKRRLRVMRICFESWIEEVKCEKISQQDALSWFHKGKEIDTKLSTFKLWKNNLTKVCHADKFRRHKLEGKVKTIIQRWNLFTKQSLNESSSQFSLSLRRKLHTGSSCSSVTGSVASMGLSENKFHTELKAQSSFNSANANVNSKLTSDSGVDISRGSHSEVSSYSDMKQFHLGNTAVVPKFEPLALDACLDDTVENVLCNTAVIQNPNQSSPVMHYDDTKENTSGNTDNSLLYSDHRMSLFDLIDSDDVRDPIDDVTMCLYSIEKANFPFEVLTLESTQSRLEGLVSFALHRLSTPELSKSFYQWKLCVHDSNRTKSLNRFAEERILERKLQFYFRSWKRNFNKSIKSRQHCKRLLLQPTFIAWKERTKSRNKIKSIKRIANVLNDHRIVRNHFKLWWKGTSEKVALNEILKYWQSRVRSHDVIIEQECLANSQREQTLLRRCVDVWKLRQLQLKSCDHHFNQSQLRRCIRSWVLYTQQCKDKKNKMAVIQHRIVMTSCYKVWVNRMKLMEKVKTLRSLCMRSRMTELCKRWKVNAKEIHDLRIKSESVVSRSNATVLTAVFSIWKHKYLLRVSADSSHARSTMRRALKQWRNRIVEDLTRKQKLVGWNVRQEERKLSSCYHIWYKEHKRLVALKRFELHRAQIWWSAWQRKLHQSRIENTHNRTLLHHYFVLWRNNHHCCVDKKTKARAVINKWHSLTTRNLHLMASAQQFLSKRHLMKLHAWFIQWREMHGKAVVADLHVRRVQCNRYFTTWVKYATSRKSQATNVKLIVHRKSYQQLRSAWKRWKEELQRKKNDYRMLKMILDARIGRYFIIWRKNLDLHFATKDYQRRTWKLWMEATNNKQVAIQHYEEKMELLLKKVLNEWHIMTSHNQLLRNNQQCLSSNINNNLVSGCFRIWKREHDNLMIAKSYDSNHELKRRFMRWRKWVEGRNKTKLNIRKSVEFSNKRILKKHFNLWHHRVVNVQNMEFISDELVSSKQHQVMVETWGAWKAAYYQKISVKHWKLKTQRTCFAGWTEYTSFNKREKNLIKIHENLTKRRFFTTWKRELAVKNFRRKHDQKLLHTTWESWTDKTSALAVAETYHHLNTQRKVWAVWRLHYITNRTEKRFVDEQNFRLKMSALQAWIRYCQKR